MAAKSLTDCPSNLKEAIDWILRVTSKDGGSGPGGTQQLAQAITKLEGFNEAIKASAGKLKDNKSGDATKALRELNNPTTLGPIIGQLSDGLKAFIGYGSGGKGIALVIDPLQQLRKGVLSFLLMMLDKLRGSIDAYTDVSDTLNKAIKGGDVVTFESAMQEVSKLQENSATGSQVKGVVSALKNIGSLRGKNDLNKLSQGFKEYLKAVLGAVENTVKEKAPQASPHVSTLCFQLQTLLEEVGKQSNDIHSQINAVEAAKTTLYANKGSGHPASTLIPAVTYGTANLLTQLKKDGYKSSYQPTLNWNGKDNKDRVSQIFLGCLPLYYYWLTCIGSVVRTGESGRGSALIAAPSKLSWLVKDTLQTILVRRRVLKLPLCSSRLACPPPSPQNLPTQSCSVRLTKVFRKSLVRWAPPSPKVIHSLPSSMFAATISQEGKLWIPIIRRSNPRLSHPLEKCSIGFLVCSSPRTTLISRNKSRVSSLAVVSKSPTPARPAQITLSAVTI